MHAVQQISCCGNEWKFHFLCCSSSTICVMYTDVCAYLTATNLPTRWDDQHGNKCTLWLAAVTIALRGKSGMRYTYVKGNPDLYKKHEYCYKHHRRWLFWIFSSTFYVAYNVDVLHIVRMNKSIIQLEHYGTHGRNHIRTAHSIGCHSDRIVFSID